MFFRRVKMVMPNSRPRMQMPMPNRSKLMSIRCRERRPKRDPAAEGLLRPHFFGAEQPARPYGRKQEQSETQQKGGASQALTFCPGRDNRDAAWKILQNLDQSICGAERPNGKPVKAPTTYHTHNRLNGERSPLNLQHHYPHGSVSPVRISSHSSDGTRNPSARPRFPLTPGRV